MRLLIRSLISCLLVCVTALSFALPQSNPVPGGLIQLRLPYTEKQTPQVKFNGAKSTVIYKDNTWFALIGIPIDTKPGMVSAELTAPIHKTITFKIYPKKYPEQRLKIKNKRLVTPQGKDLKRIESERAMVETIYKKWSAAEPFSENFTPPLKGRISSVFGLRRVYNNIPGSRHMGLDIAAPSNHEIKAIHSGIVALTADLFYTGNTVIIDHGQGIFSLYAHCKEVLVDVGRHVSGGQLIARVGKTGRATGPHLHLGIIMNQVKVNPELFIARKLIVPPAPKKDQATKKTKKS